MCTYECVAIFFFNYGKTFTTNMHIPFSTHTHTHTSRRDTP